jgi:hypothetical protein
MHTYIHAAERAQHIPPDAAPSSDTLDTPKVAASHVASAPHCPRRGGHVGGRTTREDGEASTHTS